MGFAAARLALDFTDGHRRQAHVPVAKGHPGNPMTWDDMRRKFEALVSSALGSRGEALFGLVREFGRGGVLGEMRAMLARL
jgi:2-methylcitrate dehydratase PrpD